jgi:8-oxo-dGTP pyrophosphatase MutT (NUDIX family)
MKIPHEQLRKFSGLKPIFLPIKWVFILMSFRKLKQLIEMAVLSVLKEINSEDESQLIPDEQGEYHTSEGDDPRFWGNRGAGILLVAQSTGRILLTLRSAHVNEPGTWGIPGGKIDDSDESPSHAAKREAREELGYSGSLKLVPAHVFKAGSFQYFNFIGIVPEEFEPSLDWENDDAQWFSVLQLPAGLHFGVQSLLGNSLNLIKQVVEKADSNPDES